MGLMESFEERLDRLVSGTTARAFREELEPIEIAAGIQKEMDTRAAIVSRGRTLVPNLFTIGISTDDFERLDTFAEPLRQELAALALEYATKQRYNFLGAVDVRFKEDPSLQTGMFKVRSQAHADSGASTHASVQQIPAQPAAGTGTTAHPRIIVGANSYPLTKSHTRIGRGTNADIDVDDPNVSRAHADIILGLPVVVRDLGSTNGTLVDGRRVSEAPLHDGAQIQVGFTKLTFRDA